MRSQLGLPDVRLTLVDSRAVTYNRCPTTADFQSVYSLLPSIPAIKILFAHRGAEEQEDLNTYDESSSHFRELLRDWIRHPNKY